MKWRIGDKVKFLNEAGGGYVTEIMSPSMVKVSNEDGFEIPYPVSELLQLQTATEEDPAAKFFDEEYSSPPELVEKSEAEAVVQTDQSSKLFKRKSMQLKEGVYLAFVPQDQKWLTGGLMDIYLLNHSAHDILFALFQNQEEEGSVLNKDYDAIGPHSKYLIDTIEREDLETYAEGYVQALFIPTKPTDKVIAPLNKQYKTKLAKLYQEKYYKFVDILNENAFVLEMGNMEYLSMISKKIPKAEQASQDNTKLKPTATERSLIEYHKTAILEAEVDLHISALMDDYSHLKAHDILDKQMDYFNRCLEDAMRLQYKKVIFIHGIGNGTLKKRLKDELRGYEEIEVRDASYQRYGYGAIEVNIHYL